MYVGLERAFKWTVTIDADQVPEIANCLYESRPGAPNGSSFAVTSDAPSGKRKIWLSDVSYETLKRKLPAIMGEPEI